MLFVKPEKYLDLLEIMLNNKQRTSRAKRIAVGPVSAKVFFIHLVTEVTELIQLPLNCLPIKPLII